MSWHIETKSMGKVVLICNDKGHPLARMCDDRDYASAALIAAAPELLDALLNALPYVEDILSDKAQLACFKSGVVQRHASAIRAAIAKATGEQA